jgi:hypothetical protein
MCSAFQSSAIVLSTNVLKQVEVSFQYEMTFLRDSTVTELLSVVEEGMLNLMVRDSLKCTEVNTRRHRLLQNMLSNTISYNETAKTAMIGMSSLPVDSINNKETCHNDNMRSVETCVVTNGGYTIMLNNQEVEEYRVFEIKTEQLEMLQNAAQKGLFDNLHPNITGFSYLGPMTSDKYSKETIDDENTDINKVQNVEVSNDEYGHSSQSKILISIGVVSGLLCVFAVLFLYLKRKKSSSYIVHNIDELQGNDTKEVDKDPQDNNFDEIDLDENKMDHMM